MSSNPISDAVLEELIAIVEDEHSAKYLPKAFVVVLDEDELKAFVKAGLVCNGKTLTYEELGVNGINHSLLDYTINFRLQPDPNAIDAEPLH